MGAPTTNGPAFQITSRDQATTQNEAPSVAIVVLGGLALIEAALVASAAFAVSIRRRERDLGLLAATGAEPRHRHEPLRSSSFFRTASGLPSRESPETQGSRRLAG